MAEEVGGSETTAQWVIRQAPGLCRAVAYLVAALVVAPFLYHLARGSNAYLGLFEDDYFYYAVIADKLAAVGRLTFDGTTPTNGFHPLWFVVVFLLRLLAGGLTGAFYVMLSGVFFASMIVTYELSSALARSLGASAALAPVVAVVHCLATDVVLSSGMETAVDVPLLSWLLLEISRSEPLVPRRAAKLGFIASLAILARLDIALLVAMAIVGWIVLVRPSLATCVRLLAPFCAAGLALPAYVAFNLAVFGSPMPVSALAKQLIVKLGINVPYLRWVMESTVYGRTAGLSLAAGAVALAVLWRGRARAPAVARPEALFAGGLAIAFAAVFYAMNALNGWCYFGWYAYPLGPALVAALTFIFGSAAARVPPGWRVRASVALLAVVTTVASARAARYFAAHGPRWSVADNGLLALSFELADRMRGREGVFGMGAIAGFVTYVLDKPVVQLEGLVADRGMVEHIRRQDDLGSVLAAYKVDYLVVSLVRGTMQKRDGCYSLTQPHPEWSGERVAMMRGELCAEPIEHFVTEAPSRPWSVFSRIDTYVFDVRGARWRTPTGA